LQEAECFVVFDDARCRGADLKLRRNALALLTLAPGLQKDKLMQVRAATRWQCCVEVLGLLLSHGPRRAKGQAHADVKK
jgi:hypothetical protein